jgi:hypothetical protein
MPYFRPKKTQKLPKNNFTLWVAKLVLFIKSKFVTQNFVGFSDSKIGPFLSFMPKIRLKYGKCQTEK